MERTNSYPDANVQHFARVWNEKDFYPSQKADADIHHEVCEALTENPRLLTNGIEIEIKNGVVYLRGKVMSRIDKREAERCVENLVGVRDVMNELHFE